MNVLLVDDEPTIRKLITSMLRSSGFHVLDAGNGLDAFALSQENPVELLVTDVVMEGMDGFSLADALIAQRPHLPIVFISGHPLDFEKVRRRYLRCAFLAKPFQKNELLNLIGELCKVAA